MRGLMWPALVSGFTLILLWILFQEPVTFVLGLILVLGGVIVSGPRSES
jgi:hypothetical protein